MKAPIHSLTLKQAIQAIVTYNTLPPQIDYTLPWRLKAIKAEKFLDELSQKEYDEASAEIKKQTESYYSPEGAAQYDKLF